MTSVSQSVPGTWQDSGESVWTSRVSCEFVGSCNSFEGWLQFSGVQKDLLAEVRQQLSSAEQELGLVGWEVLCKYLLLFSIREAINSY